MIAEGLTNQAIAARTGINAAQCEEKHILEHLLEARPAPDSGSEQPARARRDQVPRASDAPAREPPGTTPGYRPPGTQGDPLAWTPGRSRRCDACRSTPRRGLPMQSILVQAERPDPSPPEAVVSARDLSAVTAPATPRPCAARRLGRHRPGPPDGRDGPVGLRQVDADAHPGRPRQADRRLRDRRRPGHRRSRRHGADAAAPRPHRLHLPVLQPAPDAPAAENSCCRRSSPAASPTGLADELLETSGCRSPRPSTASPAASSSAWPSPARSSRARG